MNDLQQRIARRLPEVYLICALIVVLFLCVLTPPFFVPDEANHSKRELQLASGHLLPAPGPTGAGGNVDMNALAVMEQSTGDMVKQSAGNGRLWNDKLRTLQGIRCSNTEQFSRFPNTAVYPPLLYLPQVAGWGIARREQWTVVHGLLLARVLAALCAVAVGWAALKLSVCGRWSILLLLLVPTVLSLNASASQDALLFNLVALSTALLGRPLQARRSFLWWELLATAVLLAACVGARASYLPLFLVLFLPALDMPVFRKGTLLWPAAVALCGVLTVALWQSEVRPMGVSTDAGADIAQQKSFMLAHPVRATRTVVRSAVIDAPAITRTGLVLLGRNEVTPPDWAYSVYIVSLLLILLFSGRGCLAHWRSRLLLIAAIFCTVLSTCLAGFVLWSPPGSKIVFGLQARYFLPLLVLLMLALPRKLRLDRPSRYRAVLLTGAWSVVALILILLPVLIARRFYDLGIVPALQLCLR